MTLEISINQIHHLFCHMHAAAVRKEISDETDRITGKTKQISNIPIHLSIYSPNGIISVTLHNI